MSETGSFWDSTKWEVIPRPFLDPNSLAYATAVAAWARGNANPEWASDLPSIVGRPMKKSLLSVVAHVPSPFAK